jgi:hypothetical protein
MKLGNILENSLLESRADMIAASKTLSYEEVIKELTKPKYSQSVEAFRNRNRIFRGVKTNQDYLLSSQHTIKRVSANTTNSYNILFSDILPAWNKYPKRSNSIICTSDYAIARGYSLSVPHAVFLENNTKIGVCSAEDLWYSFRKGLEKITTDRVFESWVDSQKEIISKMAGDDFNFYSPSVDYKFRFRNLSYLSDALSYLTKHLGPLERELKMSSRFMKHKYDGKRTIGFALNTFLDPEYNGFRLSTIGDKLPPERECWFSAPCLLIKATDVEGILKNIQ